MVIVNELRFKTIGKMYFLDITADVEKVVRESGVNQGVVVIFVPHTTAGITINENADPDVVQDMKVILKKLIPWEGPYKHLEGNSAAHMMASLLGASETIIIDNGKLILGAWQGIYLAEFDGARDRKVLVRIQE